MRQWLLPVVLLCIFASASYLFVFGPGDTSPATGFVVGAREDYTVGSSTFTYFAPIVVDKNAPEITFTKGNVLSSCGTSANPCTFDCVGMDCSLKFEVQDSGAGIRSIEYDCMDGEGSLTEEFRSIPTKSIKCDHIGSKDDADSQTIEVTATDWVGNTKTVYAKAENSDCTYEMRIWHKDDWGPDFCSYFMEWGLSSVSVRKVKMRARACGDDVTVTHTIYFLDDDKSKDKKIDGREWGSWQVLDFTETTEVSIFECSEDEFFGSIDGCQAKFYLTEYSMDDVPCCGCWDDGYV